MRGAIIELALSAAQSRGPGIESMLMHLVEFGGGVGRGKR